MTNRPEAILLDCFGTLVDYEPSRTALAYDHTYRYLRDLGFAGAYESFVGSWDAMSSGFDGIAEQTLEEYSMDELAASYLSAYGIPPLADHIDGFLDLFLHEWRVGVSSIRGVDQLLADLHRDHRLVVVTNTHDDWLPRDVLDQFGLLAHLDGVLTSIEHGRRKPDTSIFEAALALAGVDAAGALFVGDGLVPDYEGPRGSVGIDARLIDPAGEHPIPAAHRISSVLDLADLVSV